jgi:hypothetical protein
MKKHILSKISAKNYKSKEISMAFHKPYVYVLYNI